jgi:hypothetical protein
VNQERWEKEHKKQHVIQGEESEEFDDERLVCSRVYPSGIFFIQLVLLCVMNLIALAFFS